MAARNAQLDEVVGQSPLGAVVVLEFGGHHPAILDRMIKRFRPLVAEREMSVVAVAETRLPPVWCRGADHVVAAAEFVDPVRLVAGDGLSDLDWSRLLDLVGRRTAVAWDVLDAAAVCPDAVIDALERSRRCRTMLDRLTANLLERRTPAQLAALEVCATTGFWHPEFAIEPVQASDLRPWVVPLERHWGSLRPIWARSLRRMLRRIHDYGDSPRPRRAIAQAHEPRLSPNFQGAPRPRATVDARFLGAFEVRVDGVGVSEWNGQRGVSVLRYVLSRRQHACPRDELLAQFWPEVEPQAARNRLQVAVSGIRRTLLQVTNLYVLEYADGAYRINRDLRVETDVNRFERALSTARQTERAGDLDGALASYHKAIDEYRGDFAADAPYEQWTFLPRESFRTAYIDALDRLCRIEFGQGRLDECIATGQRMLEIDPCREDAHRMLMRCYARQGRIYQAIRQYEFCRRVLMAILQDEPGPKTKQLYRAVIAGSYAPDLVS